MRACFISLFFLVCFSGLAGQEFRLNNSWLEVWAGPGDPLYTTYTAAIDRSRLYGDQGYKMDYFSGSEPLNYSTDRAGRIYTVWKIDKLVVNRMDHYSSKPRVYASFPDMALLTYSPMEGILVEETFWVYSSRVAMVRQKITNQSAIPHLVEAYPVLELGNQLLQPVDSLQGSGMVVHRQESLKRLISNMYPNAGYPEEIRDLILAPGNYSWGSYTGGIAQFYEYMKTDFYAEDFKNDRLNRQLNPNADCVALHRQFQLAPGESAEMVWFRGVQPQAEELDGLLKEVKSIDRHLVINGIRENEQLFASVPVLSFDNPADKLIYLSGFNLARGCMLPPTGQAAHNFYVFSREPKWGWGHGHQVLHESLSMLSYALLDPESAEGSQRIYMV